MNNLNSAWKMPIYVCLFSKQVKFKPNFIFDN